VHLESTAAVPVAQLALVKPGELPGGLTQATGPAVFFECIYKYEKNFHIILFFKIHFL
jgi:hypothetical protein